MATSRDRAYGAMGGEGPIPFSSMNAYCDEMGITDPDLRALVRQVVGRMDDAYLGHVGEEAKREAEKSKRPDKTKGG